MARQFSVNNYYPKAMMGHGPLFDLKTLMAAHGWVVGSSSDGTANFGATDYILTATDLTSRYSWMVLHHTASKREWLFGMHNDTDTREWYIGYSANVGGVAGFTGGTLTAMPAATDETSIMSDRSAIPRDIFPQYDNCYCHMMVNDASASFYLVTVIQDNHYLTSCIAGDQLTGTHTLDADPYVAIATYMDETRSYSDYHGPWSSTEYSCWTRSWYKYPSGSAERTYALHFGVGSSGTLAPGNRSYGSGVSVYDGKDLLYPVIWGRTMYYGGGSGFKGVSSLFHNVSTIRAPCDILTVGAEKMILAGAFLVSANYSNNVALPWDPTATPL